MEIRELLAQKNITVRYEPLQNGMRGFASRMNGRWCIVVNEDDRPERQHFTLAHEYFEIELDGRRDLTLDEKHAEADRRAAEFLLPEQPFRNALKTHDLHELKKRFPAVSYEAIARRFVRFVPAVVTIFDNGSVTARFSSDGLVFPRRISPVERRVFAECSQNAATVTADEPPLSVSGYVLDEMNGIVRIYLVAEIDEYAD